MITYHYHGGPLDGRTGRRELPADPSVPTLHRHGTKAKGSEIILVAQGVYHLEKREQGIPIPNDIPMAELEWRAIHHPSDQDRDWHEHKPEQPKPAVAPATPEKTKKPPIKIDADHPLARRLMPWLKMKAMEQIKAKEKTDGEG